MLRSHLARVLPHLPLYQGDVVAAATEGPRFGTLVLCAEELPLPARDDMPGVRIVDARIDDSELSLREAWTAEGAAGRVVRDLTEGRSVLVTCFAGRNRSGLVVGLALRRMGVRGADAVGLVRQARGPSALSNESFVRYLTS